MQTAYGKKVQVWIARASDYADISHFEALLNEDERARASRFVYTHDRKNFVLAHGMKRKYLAEAMGISDPSILQFSAYSSGKPYLVDANIHFNLSHSHGISALAVSSQPCGIDIEAHRPISQLPMLIEKTMTANEQSEIKRSSSPLKAFMDRWVVKEAFLKLSGIGLGLPMASLCTESEIKGLHESFSLLRGAALLFQRGHDYSIAVSSTQMTGFDLRTDGGMALRQGFA